jgi:death on curing protein
MREPIWVSDSLTIAIHHRQLAEHGGQEGIRDQGLLESALNRPKQKFSYEIKAGLAKLAAAYAFGLAKNHPFMDGNKRTALVASIVFLKLNGHDIKVDKKEAYLTFYDLAAGRIEEEQLADWFESKLVKASEEAA